MAACLDFIKALRVGRHTRQVSDNRRRRARTPQPSEDGAVSEGPVLPEVSSDERAEGWGDDPGERPRDEQWYRRERPPHHE